VHPIIKKVERIMTGHQNPSSPNYSENGNLLCNKDLSRDQVEKILKEYLKHVNTKMGQYNCFEVARRVLAILRDGLKEQYKVPVSTKTTKARTYPITKNGKIITSSIPAQDLPEISEPIEEDFRDVTIFNDNGEITNTYYDLAAEGIKMNKIRLRKACREDFIDCLQNLPMDPYGRSYGLVLYTHEATKPGVFKDGHMIAFYVDSKREVYFIDAQDNNDPTKWIQKEPAKGYREELFYVPCTPVKMIKKEEAHQEEVRANVKEKKFKQEPLDIDQNYSVKQMSRFAAIRSEYSAIDPKLSLLAEEKFMDHSINVETIESVSTQTSMIEDLPLSTVDSCSSVESNIALRNIVTLSDVNKRQIKPKVSSEQPPLLRMRRSPRNILRAQQLDYQEENFYKSIFSKCFPNAKKNDAGIFKYFTDETTFIQRDDWKNFISTHPFLNDLLIDNIWEFINFAQTKDEERDALTYTAKKHRYFLSQIQEEKTKIIYMILNNETSNEPLPKKSLKRKSIAISLFPKQIASKKIKTIQTESSEPGKVADFNHSTFKTLLEKYQTKTAQTKNDQLICRDDQQISEELMISASSDDHGVASSSICSGIEILDEAKKQQNQPKRKKPNINSKSNLPLPQTIQTSQTVWKPIPPEQMLALTNRALIQEHRLPLWQQSQKQTFIPLQQRPMFSITPDLNLYYRQYIEQQAQLNFQREQQRTVHETTFTFEYEFGYDLIYQSIPGDGHCLYNAVALCCALDEQTLRNRVAGHIRTNLDEYQSLINGLEGDNGRSVNEYLIDIEAGKEWADNLEIAVLMKILDRPIIIVESNNRIRNLSNVEDNNRLMFPGEPIFVYYNGHNHYDALIRKNDINISGIDIFNKLKQGNITILKSRKANTINSPVISCTSQRQPLVQQTQEPIQKKKLNQDLQKVKTRAQKWIKNQSAGQKPDLFTMQQLIKQAQQEELKIAQNSLKHHLEQHLSLQKVAQHLALQAQQLEQQEQKIVNHLRQAEQRIHNSKEEMITAQRKMQLIQLLEKQEQHEQLKFFLPPELYHHYLGLMQGNECKKSFPSIQSPCNINPMLHYFFMQQKRFMVPNTKDNLEEVMGLSFQHRPPL
jgi:OTU-like cysteine protease